jgi:hypothetical protein
MNYRVHAGDTLGKIAHKFHTSVHQLAVKNHIHNVNLIHTGQTLHVDGFDKKPATHHPAPAAHHHAAPVSHSGVHVTAAMKRLAAAGKHVALGMGGYRGLGLCATGVSRAIHSALHLSVHGNGNQIDNNLPRRHFKQLHISLAQALKIPGLVLTWEHTSSRLGQRYGHTAITQGDGRSSTSDFVERNTLHAGGRSGLKIFLPI